MNIITQIFGNIGSSENSLKDILAILVSSITIIIAIYYALNVFLNMEKEEKVMNIYGYNKKSIDVHLLMFIIVYSLPFIMGLFLNNILNVDYVVSNIIYTILIIYINLSLSSKKEFSIVSIFVCSIIYVIIMTLLGFLYNYFTLLINLFLIFGCLLLNSRSFYLLIKSKKQKKYNNLYLNDLTISLSMIPFFVSCIFFSLISLFIYMPEPRIKYPLMILYFTTSLIIFEIFYKKDRKISSKKIEITLKKDTPESTKYEHAIGFIISETNDDIVFEIDRVLHRYRKSDIYCIKEYKNPYSSILKELNDFSQRIQIDLGKIKDKEIISNYKSIKDNILNLNKMNDNHYDSIINTMKEDISKVKKSLSKIEKDKTTEHHKNIKKYLSSINNIIDKIAKKKQELEQEKKKQETPN